VRVALGSYEFDVTRRALVVGPVVGPDSVDVAEHLVAAGADALELDAVGADVARVRARLDVPIVVRFGDTESLRSALAAGASAAVVPGGSADPEQLELIVAAAASVVIDPGALATVTALERAGLPPSRIVSAAITDPGSGPGPVAAAITAGVRVVRTTDVRTARRVADVLAAVMAARDEPRAAP
jgi:hypothetical protein